MSNPSSGATRSELAEGFTKGSTVSRRMRREAPEASSETGSGGEDWGSGNRAEGAVGTTRGQIPLCRRASAGAGDFKSCLKALDHAGCGWLMSIAGSIEPLRK